MGRKVPFQEAALVVKQALDIVEVVGRVVVLKKTGRNYKGLCPFHQDKSPSFNVNPAKQIYKCFSCGEGGDSLSFLMKTQNKGYKDLISELAAEQGLEIESTPYQAQTKALNDELLEAHQLAQQYYVQQGQASSELQGYLSDRAIPSAWQARFGLGLAPAGWDNLMQAIIKSNPAYKDRLSVLEKGGLLMRRQEQSGYGDGFYDRFRHRLMIPIHDEKGRVIAFGGRSLKAEDQPKYMNSPETPIYIKSRVLYGFHLAKEAIQTSGHVVVMEGYFDVIRAHMVGLTQSVGVCGTALTMDHLKLLSRSGAQTLYLCFDSDAAGQKAILRTIEQIESVVWDMGFQMKVVQLPSGKDPDEYFRATMPEGQPDVGIEASADPGLLPEGLVPLLSQAVDFLVFKLTYYLNEVEQRHSPRGRIEAVRHLLPHLAKIEQPVVQQTYVQWAANELGVPLETLVLELKRYKSNNMRSPGAEQAIVGFEGRYLGERVSHRSTASPYRQGYGKRSYANRPDDIASLRAHLAVSSPDDAMAKKEDELMAWLFLNQETFMTVYAHCSELTLLSADARRFFAGVQHVVQTCQQSMQIDQLADVLKTYWHEQNELPMVTYLANRLMELDALYERYNLDENQLHSGNHRAKLMRIVGDILRRIKLDQHRQSLVSLAKQAKQPAIDALAPQNTVDPGLEAQLLLREALLSQPTVVQSLDAQTVEGSLATMPMQLGAGSSPSISVTDAYAPVQAVHSAAMMSSDLLDSNSDATQASPITTLVTAPVPESDRLGFVSDHAGDGDLIDDEVLFPDSVEASVSDSSLVTDRDNAVSDFI